MTRNGTLLVLGWYCIGALLTLCLYLHCVMLLPFYLHHAQYFVGTVLALHWYCYQHCTGALLVLYLVLVL